jgi:hypothetical protein
MAAGLGFKTFTTGEVLTAADTNGYLMQGVLVFASAAARDAAITSPQEGQFAYLKDTNVTTYYTGSAWTNLDTTGMTNPMTTTGDMVYSSSGSTPARLGIGSTGNVLTVSGGVPVWSAPAGGGKVLQVVHIQTTTQDSTSSTTFSDTSITATITPSATSSKVLILMNTFCAKTAGSADNRLLMRLLRGATDLSSGLAYGSFTADYGFFQASATRFYGTLAYNYLDSPSTTSATTYKIQLKNGSATAEVQTSAGNAPSTMTLLEIGA